MDSSGSRSNWSRIASVAAIAMSMATAAQATEGWFTHAWGTRSKGMAGASLAYPLDALSGAINPAHLAYVGNRVDVGLAFFMPIRGFETTAATTGMFPLAPGSFSSSKELFFVPSLGFNYSLKDERSSIGFLIYGNGGMNTDYSDAVFGAGEAGVNLEQMFISPTYAYRATDKTKVGLGLIYCIQHFKAEGLGNFAPMSSDPSHLTDLGHDVSTGIGFKLGVQHEINDKFSVAATYEPKINMSRLDKYAGLFAEQGNFDIPESFSLGLAWHPSSDKTWTFDIRHIKYSGVRAVGNPFSSSGPLGSDDGPGFGWRDMTSFKLGHEWQGDPLTKWRVGVSYGRQPIPESETLFNILAPGVQEWELTAGFTRKLSKGELSFAMMYSPTKRVSGANPMAPTQTIELNMHQFEFELGYTFRF